MLNPPLPETASLIRLNTWEGVIAWIEQALAVLEAITITPPPATQTERVDNLIAQLLTPAPPATLAPRSAPDLTQTLKEHFSAGSDAVLQVVTKLQPELESVFYTAYRNLAYRAPQSGRSATRPRPDGAPRRGGHFINAESLRSAPYGVAVWRQCTQTTGV